MQCPKVRWRQCEACQRRIQEEGLEDEFHLQSWFVGRINTFLKAQGRILIGWDEILEGGLSPGAVVMSWRVGLLELRALSLRGFAMPSPLQLQYLQQIHGYTHGQNLASRLCGLLTCMFVFISVFHLR